MISAIEIIFNYKINQAFSNFCIKPSNFYTLSFLYISYLENLSCLFVSKLFKNSVSCLSIICLGNTKSVALMEAFKGLY